MITQKTIKFDFHSYDCSCDLQIVDEIESLKSIYFDFWFHDQSCIYKNVHEIESYQYSRSKVTNTVGAAYCDHFVPNQIWLTVDCATSEAILYSRGGQTILVTGHFQ